MKICDKFSVGNEVFIVELDDSYQDGGIVYVKNENYGFNLSQLDFYCMVSWLYLARRNMERIYAVHTEYFPIECARKQIGNSILVVDRLKNNTIRITYFWQLLMKSQDFFDYVEHLMNCMDVMVDVENFKCRYYDPIFLANDAYKDVYVLEKIEMDKIRAEELLIYDRMEDGEGKLIPVRNGRVYKALEGDFRRCSQWEQINYFGLDNESRCTDMYQKIAEEGYQPEKYGAYIVLSEDTRWIRDGSHRVACILKKFGDTVVTVARWYRKGGLRQKDRAFLSRMKIEKKRSIENALHEREKIIVYGAGDNFKCYFPWFSNRYEIIGVIDGDDHKVGSDIRGYEVESLESLRNKAYDYVLITPNAYATIKKNLLVLGVEPEKILILHEISNANVGKDFISICFDLKGSISDYLINLNFILCFYNRICNPQCFIDIAVNSNVEFMKELCEVRKLSGVIREVRTGIGDDKNKYDIIVSINSRYPEILQAKEDRLVRLLPDAIDYVLMCRKFKILNRRYFQSCNTAYVAANGTSGQYELLFSRKRIMQPDVYNFLSLGVNSYLSLDVDPKILKKYDLIENNFMTLHAGLFKNKFYRSSTLAWPEEEIFALVKLLRQNYINYKIVLIHGVGVTKVNMDDVDVLIEEDIEVDVIKTLMKCSRLHVDSDDFLVHLRHLLDGGVSAVVFGPTSKDFHGYEENINIGADKCSMGCEGVAMNWDQCCMKSSGKALCMRHINAKQVFDLIESNGGIAIE